jgi:hypothetical protein
MEPVLASGLDEQLALLTRRGVDLTQVTASVVRDEDRYHEARCARVRHLEDRGAALTAVTLSELSELRACACVGDFTSLVSMSSEPWGFSAEVMMLVLEGQLATLKSTRTTLALLRGSARGLVEHRRFLAITARGFRDAPEWASAAELLRAFADPAPEEVAESAWASELVEVSEELLAPLRALPRAELGALLADHAPAEPDPHASRWVLAKASRHPRPHPLVDLVRLLDDDGGTTLLAPEWVFDLLEAESRTSVTTIGHVLPEDTDAVIATARVLLQEGSSASQALAAARALEA